MSEYTNKVKLELLDRLKADNPQAKVNGVKLEGVRCPVCGKPEAFIDLNKGIVLFCHRNNECGASTNLRTIYPECFGDFSKKFPATKEKPNRTAEVYLASGRGLDSSKIEFTQGRIYDKETNRKYDTVKFEIAPGIYNERLIDYKGKNKNRSTGSFKGKVYEAFCSDNPETIYIVEGIIDAISLQQSGFDTIAIICSGTLPKEYYQKNLDKTFIFAFDNDKAGHKAVDKHIKYFESVKKKSGDSLLGQYKIMFLPAGKDANDLLVVNRLNDEMISESLWRGQLHTAKSAAEYYELYCDRKGDFPLVFTFHNQTYRGYIKEGKDELIRKTLRLTNCKLEILYTIKDNADEYKPKLVHKVRLTSRKGRSSIIDFSTEELATLSNFKIRLMNSKHIFFAGNNELTLLTDYLFSHQCPIIRQTQCTGYDKESKCYVLSSFLYNNKGRRIEANKYNYFDTEKLMPFYHGSASQKIITGTSEIDLKKFFDSLYRAYEFRGLLALGFWIASTFSHVVFDKYNLFPFLSLYGDTRCGKTYLTILLNCCFFVDWEGLSMTKTNTAKGEKRKISQFSSMVVPLLEGSKEDSRFDYDSILPLYNRNPLQERAQTTNDNRTHSLDFKGTIAFVWNHEQFIKQAAKERVISSEFLHSQLTGESFTAHQELQEYSREELAFVGHSILFNRNYYESEAIEAIEKCTAALSKEGVTVDRIVKNHAIPMAFVMLFMEQLGLDDQEIVNGFINYMVKISKRKIQTAKTDNVLAEDFFDTLLNKDANMENGYIIKDDQLLVHMPTVKNIFPQVPNKDVLNALKQHESYTTSKQICRLPAGSKSCWNFNIRQIDNFRVTGLHEL